MAYAPWFCLLLWSVFLKGVLAGEDCFVWKHFKWEYCQLGCCGDGFERECCSMVGIIVGSCVGGLVLMIAVIIAVICCCIKHKGKSDQVMSTNTTTVAYVGQHSKYYCRLDSIGSSTVSDHSLSRIADAAYDLWELEQNIYSDPAYPPPDPDGESVHSLSSSSRKGE